jgi:hypothetical protein
MTMRCRMHLEEVRAPILLLGLRTPRVRDFAPAPGGQSREPGGGGPLGRKPDMHRAQYGAIALSCVRSEYKAFSVNQTQTVARYLGRARAETSSLVRPTSVGPPD